MKKYISVFGLVARGSIYKVLICFVLLITSESILFSIKLNEALKLYSMDFSMKQLETLVDQSFISWCFAICFALIVVVLCLMGTEYSNSQTSYTIKRLQISERALFFCQASYNIIIFIVLWAVQAITVCILSIHYAYAAPEEFVGNQTIFLAFYRNNLLHNILPVSDVFVWIRNIFIAVGLGFAAAEFPYRQRRKKIGTTIIAFSLYTICFFINELANTFNIFITIIVSIAIVAETLYTVFKQDEEVSENVKN